MSKFEANWNERLRIPKLIPNLLNTGETITLQLYTMTVTQGTHQLLLVNTILKIKRCVATTKAIITIHDL